MPPLRYSGFLHSFFSGCHLFIPLFDPAYDTYESLTERSPWTFDAILAVAGKIRSGNGSLSPTFHKCLEEAQGIARSSLFGPVVRKEAVQGNFFLPSTISYYRFNRNVVTGCVECTWMASKWSRYAHGIGSWIASCVGKTCRR